MVIAEILRAGIAALPGGQAEAAYAIGLPASQTLRLILLPQAFRIMLPALISQLVVILKDTVARLHHRLRGAAARRQPASTLSSDNPIQTVPWSRPIFIVINYAADAARAYDCEPTASRSRAERPSHRRPPKTTGR